MTSTSATTNSVFQAFIEAQHALEQLPAVEQELARTKTELDTTHHALDDAELRAMQLEDDLKALRATLAAKEEALAAATFREGEMAGKLAVIQSVIGVRQPEPVVVHSESVTRGEAASTNEHPQEDSHMGEGGGNHAGDVRDPNTAGSTDTATGTGIDYTHTEDSHMGEAHSHAGSRAATPPTAYSSTATFLGDVSSEDQSEAGPTHPTDTGHTASTTTESTSVQSRSASNSGVAPSANPTPYWRKPANQSWSDWVSAGNEPAPWLGKDFFDPHTVAAK